jgi:hypothetical protein
MASEMTIHLHGLRNKWYNDGVAYLQQCPIATKSVSVKQLFALIRKLN